MTASYSGSMHSKKRSVHLSLIIPIPKEEDSLSIKSRNVSIPSNPKWNKLFNDEGAKDLILYTPLLKRAGVVRSKGRFKIPTNFSRQINAHARKRYLITDTENGITAKEYSKELKRSLFLQALTLRCSNNFLNKLRKLTTTTTITTDNNSSQTNLPYDSRNTCCFQWLTISQNDKSDLLTFGIFPHPNCETSEAEQILIDYKIQKWYKKE